MDSTYICAMKHTLLAIICCTNLHLSAQVSYFFGGNLSHYFYLESPQSNYAAKFNLGWDFAPSSDHQLLFFEPGTTNYSLKNELKWDQMTRGLVVGVSFATDRLKHDVYFQGCTNTGVGKRQNLSTNTEQTLHLYSKFGGLNYALHFCISEKWSVFYAFGMNRYKLLYSFDDEKAAIQKTRVGYDLKLGGALKPGSKSATFSQAVGISVQLLNTDRFNIEFRPEMRFVFNKMVNVYRGPYYEELIYNLNQINASFILHLTPNP
jgi:hypothetical protein